MKLRARCHAFVCYAIPALLVVVGILQMSGVAFAAGTKCQVQLIAFQIVNPAHDPSDPDSPPTINVVRVRCVPKTCPFPCMEVGFPPSSPTAGQTGAPQCLCGPEVPQCMLNVSWVAQSDGQGGVKIGWIVMGGCKNTCPSPQICDQQNFLVPSPVGPVGATACDCQ